MRTPDVVNRITTLEQAGRITGVLDDRGTAPYVVCFGALWCAALRVLGYLMGRVCLVGKFIYISPEELDNLAAWIKRRGRVSIADFIAESNKLINLTPTAAPAAASDDSKQSSKQSS
jgi:hypothetical protein